MIIPLLAALGLHRIWNYELPWLRTQAALLPWPLGKLAACAPCNAVWIAALVVALWALVPQADLFLLPFAAYPLLRGAVWVYEHGARRLLWTPPVVGGKHQGPPPTPKPGEKLVINQNGWEIVPAEEGCKTCGDKKLDAKAEQERVLKFEKRVVILTTLANFDPSYSLTSCILDQARALAEANSNWLVQVWCMQRTVVPDGLPKNVEIRPIVPLVPWKRDEADPKTVDLLLGFLRRELFAMGNASVITHDALLVDSYLALAVAIHRFGETKGFRWFHVAHSAPGQRPTQDVGDVIYRYTLPPGPHTLVCLSNALRKPFASYYACDPERVQAIPNARDRRTWPRIDPLIDDFVRRTRLQDHGIVQVYPISTTRVNAKGLPKLIRLFGALSKFRPCALVVANPHANSETAKQVMREMHHLATQHGVRLHFTAEEIPATAQAGLPAESLHRLMSYGNLFAFPTWSEASSLVLAEAKLLRQRVVLNSSVPSFQGEDPDRFVPWGQGDEDIDETALQTLAAEITGWFPVPNRTGSLPELAGEWRELL